ncbi:preprotein translocase subunit SecE [Aquimarina sp. 2201CG5-10]|uniref:preprotein translocase subunit SecE n=1 Tax=Aquimarina callyspongiae TaxID=3098150 RepID=UPI002AB4F4B5|nr:preprotein translocase subunit SecE [Aquimarina sp. 2201CG5-10]MDY8138508.1 preprotein translocase subunit SecE [Aquimarina sp. 2201CG5-10]
MAGLINYITESYNELKNHVTWTPWAEAQRLTLVVIVFSVIFSLAIWGVDTVFSNVIEYYFKLVKS